MYRERERDRSIPNISELTTRTVTMSRDQQDGHGFGICVKAGKEPGELRRISSSFRKIFSAKNSLDGITHVSHFTLQALECTFPV